MTKMAWHKCWNGYFPLEPNDNRREVIPLDDRQTQKKQHEFVLLFNYDRILFLITIKVLYIG